MLRSLFSGISGLRSHQTMLDVTGNNIANVNTAGFKASATQFQDTLSQLIQGGGAPGAAIGGTNPAQVGLGVQLAGISTNFSQGSAQATSRASDLMISGDGFFVVQSGGETLYTRAGSFEFDAQGRLVTQDGALVMGWNAAGGQINQGGALQNLTLPRGAVSAAIATTAVRFSGNLPEDAADGTEIVRDIDVFDASGSATTVSLTFTKNTTGWEVSDGATVLDTLTFVDGQPTGPATIAVGGVTVDVSKLTGFADLSTVKVAGQDGRAAGTLDAYSIGPDGTVTGTFSNGATEAVGRIALANFVNPGGLEKAGNSTYRATANTGGAEIGAAGDAGYGALASGYLEMSNVDLSQEFTNLIIAQRGFQANARIITTSDEVLQELTNLKR
ncbi:flagellar hook protein FlgE [Agromyces sp. NPDC056379]|uniref:flagellar hook protein FlgE n=1 Tax=unclassified Agromyces TaxID=2639701 RepID=UPI0035E072BD